jgi:hypothetical protein
LERISEKRFAADFNCTDMLNIPVVHHNNIGIVINLYRIVRRILTVGIYPIKQKRKTYKRFKEHF